MAKIIVAIEIPEFDDKKSLKKDFEEVPEDWFPDNDKISIDKTYLPSDPLDDNFVSLEYIDVVDNCEIEAVKELLRYNIMI